MLQYLYLDILIAVIMIKFLIDLLREGTYLIINYLIDLIELTSKR